MANEWQSNISKEIFITGGDDVTNPDLINWIVQNATYQVPPVVTFDLSTLSGWSDVAIGQHTLQIKAKAQGYRDSNLSTGVNFTKVPATYTVTVSGRVNQSGSIYFYDGQDTQGTLLDSVIELNSSYSKTLTITSGYLCIDGDSVGPGDPSSGINIIPTQEPPYIYYEITTDGTITNVSSEPCFIEGTQITLADRTTKSVEDITYDDELLVWNFYDGKFDIAKPQWIMKEKQADNYNLVTFDNNTTLGLAGPGGNIGYHRIYNDEAKAFTHTGVSDTPNGTTTFCQDGTYPKVISQEIIEEPVKYYNIITDKHYNLFANGILTSCRLSNKYRIENMKYVGDKLISDQEEMAYFRRIDLLGK